MNRRGKKTYRIAKNHALETCRLELSAMKKDIAIRSDKGLRHVQTAPVTLSNAQDNHDLGIPCSCPNCLHMLRVDVDGVAVILATVIVNHIGFVSIYEDGVARDPKLWEPNDLCSISCGLGNETASLFHGGVDIEPSK